MPAHLEAAVDGYVAAWNEPDADLRRQRLVEALSDDFELTGPTGTFRGRDAVEGLIVALQSRLGGATVKRLGAVEAGVFRWAVTTAGGSVLLEGTDQVETGVDGRLRRVSVAAAPPSG